MTYQFSTVPADAAEHDAPPGFHLCYAELIGGSRTWALIWEENEPVPDDEGAYL